MTATSTPRSARIRTTVDAWLGTAAFLLIYLGSATQAFIFTGWREGVTFLLSGLGFVLVVSVSRTGRHALHPDDRHRLNILAAQAFAAFIVAWVVNEMFPSTPGAVPVVLGLAGVGTMLLAAEAIVIRRRGPRRT